MGIPARVKRLIKEAAKKEAEEHRKVLAKYVKPRLAKEEDIKVLRVLEVIGLVSLFPYFSKGRGKLVYKVFLLEDGKRQLELASIKATRPK